MCWRHEDTSEALTLVPWTTDRTPSRWSSAVDIRSPHVWAKRSSGAGVMKWGKVVVPGEKTKSRARALVHNYILPVPIRSLEHVGTRTISFRYKDKELILEKSSYMLRMKKDSFSALSVLVIEFHSQCPVRWGERICAFSKETLAISVYLYFVVCCLKIKVQHVVRYPPFYSVIDPL